jgi:hypothetical protein
MTQTAQTVRLLLGDRPRLEIALTPAAPAALPAWLVIALPGPTSETRPHGRFLADPRLPESEVVLRWGETTAVPRGFPVLHVSAGGQSWSLEQDNHNPERWRVQAAPEHGRQWS